MAQDNPNIRLLSYRELMITLQRLCKEKRSGIMFINDGSSQSAKINLEKGVIFDVSFKDAQGKAALDLIKQIKQGKASFSNRLGQSSNIEKKIDLSTVEIFQYLISGINKTTATQTAQPQQTASATAPIKPQTPVHSVTQSTRVPTTLEIDPVQSQPTSTPEMAFPEPSKEGAWGMSVIEAQLSTIIGPVAKIVCLNYVKDIGLANDIKTLNGVIDTISKQILIPEQQKLFRQGILAFVNQYNLKSQDAIVNALKSSDKKLRLAPTTLALCISKHNKHGQSGTTLANKLALQIERGGNLKDSACLVDVLETLEQSNKTGLLEVRSQNKRGGFYFENGVLINSVESGMNGKIIAMDILQWEPDYLVFRAEAQTGVSKQIRQTVSALVQEVEKLHNVRLRKTNRGELTKADEITLISQAIELIEACDNARAEQILTKVLMSYDDNFKAWLWLSRALTNMTAIEIALKKAAHIHSKNTELADEVRKFSQARKNISGDFVLRCPFCWTPTESQHTECPYCKSEFFITPDFFKTLGKAKTDIIDKAIERYNKVLQEENKSRQIYLRFYLAMAYLNRKYYQEALDQLQELSRLAPDNTAITTQQRILLDYMNLHGLASHATTIDKKQLSTHDFDFDEEGSPKGKILIVEDSMVTRKVIARTLMANGYQVFEAKNAFEALNDLEERNPNLILLDIVLPGKDGYEILSEVRQKSMFETTPVVMLTSRDSLFDKLKGKVSDANEYLTKPFQPDELLTVVRKYLK